MRLGVYNSFISFTDVLMVFLYKALFEVPWYTMNKIGRIPCLYGVYLLHHMQLSLPVSLPLSHCVSVCMHASKRDREYLISMAPLSSSINIL